MCFVLLFLPRRTAGGKGKEREAGASEETAVLAGEEGRRHTVGSRPSEEMSAFHPCPTPSPLTTTWPLQNLLPGLGLQKRPHPVHKDPNQMLTFSEPHFAAS